MTHNLSDLAAMTRALGEPALDYAIIGEGNTSMRIDDERFYVKASGHQMRNIGDDGFVALRFAPMLAMLDAPPQTLSEQKAITESAVIPPNSLGGTEGGLRFGGERGGCPSPLTLRGGPRGGCPSPLIHWGGPRGG